MAWCRWGESRRQSGIDPRRFHCLPLSPRYLWVAVVNDTVLTPCPQRHAFLHSAPSNEFKLVVELLCETRVSGAYKHIATTKVWNIDNIALAVNFLKFSWCRVTRHKFHHLLLIPLRPSRPPWQTSQPWPWAQRWASSLPCELRAPRRPLRAEGRPWLWS